METPDDIDELCQPDDPAKQREVQRLQADLIHLIVAYHLDRLRHGHAMALGNALRLAGDQNDSPHVLAHSIAQHGRIPQSRLAERLRAGETDISAAEHVRQGIMASVWDSMNHVLRLDTQTFDSRYADFLSDNHLLQTMVASEYKGRALQSFQGFGTIPSGFSVGMAKMKTLTAMEYGLRSRNPNFDAVRLSHTLGKSDEMKLVFLGMDFTMMSLDHTGKTRRSWSDPDSKTGVPPEKIQEFINVDKPGCSARLLVSDDAYDCICRHGLDQGMYAKKPPLSAVKIVADLMRQHAFSEWDEVRDSFSDTQIRYALSQHSVEMLFPELSSSVDNG